MPVIILDTQTMTITANERGTIFIKSKDVLPGEECTTSPRKGEFSTETTCSMFYLLEFHGISTYFKKPINASTFEARCVELLPIEVTVNRNAIDSCPKTGPNATPVQVTLFAKDEPQNSAKITEDMIEKAKQAFYIIEQAWLEFNGRLQSLTLQFGLDINTGELLIAGVINSDSWTLTFKNEEKCRSTDYERIAKLSYKTVSETIESRRIP